MRQQGERIVLTRRGVLTLAAGAGMASWGRLYAFSSDFWNKKEPTEWSSQEIEQLTTKSPWAKETGAQYSHDAGDQNGSSYPGGGGGGGYPGGGGGGMGRGGGIPGIGGMGGGGMGGGRGGRRGGQQAPAFKGTVRWESAKPILEALKTPLPDAFANHYVVSVSGFPLNGSRSRRSQDDSDSDNAAQSTQDTLDQLKSLTFLEPKGRDGAQPGVVQQSPSAGSGNILFGFSKEILALKADDREVTFSTKLGNLLVKTKFNLKEMTYRGDLAL